MHAFLNKVGQFRLRHNRTVIAYNAVTHCRIDVAVRVVAKQPPQGAVRLKSNSALLLGGIENKWDDRIFAVVFGNVFLGVVGAHLLLVDVFLEDIAHDIRIDFIVGAQGAFVEVPAVLVEEVKELFKRLIGNVNFRVAGFKFMNFKKSTIEKRNTA